MAAGELVAGAVAFPARGVTHTTEADSAGLPVRPEGSPIRLAVSRTRPPAFVTALAERLGAELVPMGSAGVKAMSVLDGTALVYNNPSPWLPDLLVCRPEVAEELLTALREMPSGTE